MIKSLILGLLLTVTLGSGLYGQQVSRSTQVGRNTYYYNKAGQSIGRSTSVGNNAYHYNSGNKFTGRSTIVGKNTYSYGKTLPK